jgi:uncharacterized protein involved in tolerance to divalent cations
MSGSTDYCGRARKSPFVHVPQIIERTNREHPYVVPCVVAVPIVAGNPNYLKWIADETVDV